MKRFSLTPLALTLALLLQGCVTYQHPQPVEAQDALKDAKGLKVFFAAIAQHRVWAREARAKAIPA